ncbi:MAG: DUF2064 domain-containing protein [Alteromonadaceae bacterium]|nr:DUF2064 domain-containing protein [Alteromonadaceae bacterium]
MDPIIFSEYTLVLLCKRPALNFSKQRLAVTIGAQEALIFAEHFLCCALEDLTQWPGQVVISPANAGDVEWVSQLLKLSEVKASGLKSRALILEQQAGNLGQRLNKLDQQLRQLGHHHILFIGSDAPILSPQDYQQVTTALSQNDIVLAPAVDGGVTIMANRKPWPSLKKLPWSTDKLRDALTLLCEKNQLSVRLTRFSYDIDLEKQLHQLAIDLIKDIRPARQALVAKIHSFFSRTTIH